MLLPNSVFHNNAAVSGQPNCQVPIAGRSLSLNMPAVSADWCGLLSSRDHLFLFGPILRRLSSLISPQNAGNNRMADYVITGQVDNANAADISQQADRIRKS